MPNPIITSKRFVMRELMLSHCRMKRTEMPESGSCVCDFISTACGSSSLQPTKANAPAPSPSAAESADVGDAAPAAPTAPAGKPEMTSAEVDALVQQLLEQARARADAEQHEGREPGMELEVAPPVMTSDAPEASADLPSTPDVAWLRGIELPDIPIRWHQQLIELLNYYRSDPRVDRWATWKRPAS